MIMCIGGVISIPLLTCTHICTDELPEVSDSKHLVICMRDRNDSTGHLRCQVPSITHKLKSVFCFIKNDMSYL